MISKYQEIVEDAFKKEDRVCSYVVDGNKVYLKKREKQKKVRHIFQGILQKITREPMLILSGVPAWENEVLVESNKIKWRKKRIKKIKKKKKKKKKKFKKEKRECSYKIDRNKV